MSDVPPHLERLVEADAEFGEDYAAIVEANRAAGALSVKTKLLMIMALDASKGYGKAVGALADRAREEGATEQEILETVKLVTTVCGMQGLAAAANGFEDFEFEV